MLERLLGLTDQRLSVLPQRDQLVGQRQWLIDLDRLLDPTEPATSGKVVAANVDHYLIELLATVAMSEDSFDQQVAAHIDQTFRHRWWGLFACYSVPGLPRTNNELETFLRELKTGQRRVTGRHTVHDFIIRYGRCAAFVDRSEGQDHLLARLGSVTYADFVRERAELEAIQLQAIRRYRFRHRRPVYLPELECRWAAACAAA